MYNSGQDNVARCLSKKFKQTIVYGYDGSISYGVPVLNRLSVGDYEEIISDNQDVFNELSKKRFIVWM